MEILRKIFASSNSNVVESVADLFLFDELPEELKVLILSHLSEEELCTAARVSRSWHCLSGTDIF